MIIRLFTIIESGGYHGVDKLGMTMTVENIWDKELKTDTIINRC